MFRKFINNYEFEKNGKQIPILNWQCLTIQFKKQHTENLIIENEKQAMMLIEYLLYELNSVDGHKNSAKPKLTKMMSG